MSANETPYFSMLVASLGGKINPYLICELTLKINANTLNFYGTELALPLTDANFFRFIEMQNPALCTG